MLKGKGQPHKIVTEKPESFEYEVVDETRTETRLNEELPILTAEERVEGAIASIRSRHEFSPEQLRWLGFIQNYLVNNLSIDLDDLEIQPVFTDRGGVAGARKLFGTRLPKLIDELNLALAA